MAIRADSYGSVDEVTALTQTYLRGEVEYNTLTQPTLTQVEKFIDRCSGVLNMALAQAGFAAPITNTTAKLSMDDWVTSKVAMYIEVSHRGSGYSGGENNRARLLDDLHSDAVEFVDDCALGLKLLGVTVTHAASESLTFTGLDAQDERSDPDDSSLEQPKFSRGLFDTT